MKISDLFKGQVGQTARNIESAQEKEARATKEESRVQNQEGEDSVSISPLGRQFVQISRVLSSEEQQRKERIAKIKEEVESGKYSVSSEQVAEAILAYGRDEPTE